MNRRASAKEVQASKRERQLRPRSGGVSKKKKSRQPQRKLLYGEAEVAFKADWTWGHQDVLGVETILYIQHASREAADKISRWIWTHYERHGGFPSEFEAIMKKALVGRILAYHGVIKTQLLGVAESNVRTCMCISVAHGNKGKVKKIIVHFPYDPVAYAEMYSAAGL